MAKAKQNHDGKLTVPSKFDTIVDERKGVYVVKRDNFFGIVDKFGKEILPPIFNYIHVVKSNVFVVETMDGYEIYRGNKRVTGECFICLNMALSFAEQY